MFHVGRQIPLVNVGAVLIMYIFSSGVFFICTEDAWNSTHRRDIHFIQFRRSTDLIHVNSVDLSHGNIVGFSL